MKCLMRYLLQIDVKSQTTEHKKERRKLYDNNAKCPKTYGNFTFEISMELPEGQILGLIGKNGAGKSTAIKLILGLCRAEEGTVTVLGSDSKELSEKSNRI